MSDEQRRGVHVGDVDANQHGIDASGSHGVQIGDHNTQINYVYGALTWSDRVAAPPLVNVSGRIESPYRGLNAFDERDAAFYFGRDGAVAELVRRVGFRGPGSHLVVVSGVSGSGKSSLLQAGLAPRLRGRETDSGTEWLVLYLVPSLHPLESLAIAVGNLTGLDAATLRRRFHEDPTSLGLIMRQGRHRPTDDGRTDDELGGSRRALLIVDQFERVFTVCRDEAERLTFVQALQACADSGAEDEGATVVVGVRADFEARCADYEELGSAVQQRFLLTTMTERQLRSAITEPARVAGAKVDDALVQTLLDELRARQARDHGSLGNRTAGAGALPLLSHALDQAWRARTGIDLTLADYERTGGIEAAIAASAQSTYELLSQRQKEMAKSVFLQLTAVQSDGLDVASRADRVELTRSLEGSSEADLTAVLEAFAAQRLITLDSETVEISHEAVLSSWPLLRDTWLAQTHADRLVRTRLRAAAQEWDRHDRDPSYLYQGALRNSAEDAMRRMRASGPRAAGPSELELSFLRVSGRAQRRRVVIRRVTSAAMAILMVGLATSTVWTTHANDSARRATSEALRQRDSALSKQLLAQSQSPEIDPDVAKTMSLAAWALEKGPDTRAALEGAAILPPGRTITGHDDAAWSLVATPHGELITGSADGTIRFWNITDGREIGPPIQTINGGSGSLDISPDGSLLITASNPDGSIRLWRAADRKMIRALTRADSYFVAATFSPSGKSVIAEDYDGRVVIWKLDKQGSKAATVADQRQQERAIKITVDGKAAYLAPSPEPLMLVSEKMAKAVKKVVSMGRCEIPLAISRQGNSIACGEYASESLSFASLSDGEVKRILTDETSSEISSIVYSPDGKLALFNDFQNREFVLLSASTGQRVRAPIQYVDSYGPATFSADGRYIIAGSQSGRLGVWETKPRAQTPVVHVRQKSEFLFMGFLRNSPETVALSYDGIVTVRSVKSGRIESQHKISISDQNLAVAFSPDRREVATASDTGLISVFHVADGSRVDRVSAQNEAVFSVAFNADGSRLVFASDQIYIVDLATKKTTTYPSPPITGSLLGSDGGSIPTQLALSSEGVLAIGTDAGTVDIVRNVTDVGHSRVFNVHQGGVQAMALTRDGTMLATGGIDGTVRLWNLGNQSMIGPLRGGSHDRVMSLAFSPDGRILAEGSADGNVRLWDLEAGVAIGELRVSAPDTSLEGGDARGGATNVEFARDGAELLTVGADGRALIWNTEYLVNPIDFLCGELPRQALVDRWRSLGDELPNVGSICTS